MSVKYYKTIKLLFVAYTALGDDRRAFSYYKALSVLEKVPFKITSVNQIKGFPTIGKSLMESVSIDCCCLLHAHLIVDIDFSGILEQC